MNQHNQISYVEFPTTNIVATKEFFASVFGWSFTDYGPDYTSFSNDSVSGGFFKSDQSCLSEKGSVLIVIYSSNLEQTQTEIEAAGGKIVQAIFSFPGGKRFHFQDPTGNEYAVWSE